jgi:PBP1b-binding outer membrane lipoprotein LpoB
MQKCKNAEERMKFISEKNSGPERFISFLLFTFIVSLFILTGHSQSYSQQGAKVKNNPEPAAAHQKRTRAQAPPVRLFDAAFKKEISEFEFIDIMTDEIEFMRIYTALADDMSKLKGAFAAAVRSADKNYSACLSAAKTSHRRELAAARDRIRNNRSPERAESLKSLLLAIEQEHKNYYESEANKAKNIFKSLFDSFNASYAIQKKFLISNTAYDSAASEIMLALGTFEAGIKEKSARIENYISGKFNAIGNGADHGDK